MVRNTHQHRTVLNTVKELKGMHPTADNVYECVKILIPTISRATVYRILNQISDDGSLKRVHIPGSAGIYDNRLDSHYHMRCNCCSRIFDIDIPYMSGLCKDATEASEHTITWHDIAFSGICGECAKNSGSK